MKQIESYRTAPAVPSYPTTEQAMVAAAAEERRCAEEVLIFSDALRASLRALLAAQGVRARALDEHFVSIGLAPLKMKPKVGGDLFYFHEPSSDTDREGHTVLTHVTPEGAALLVELSGGAARGQTLHRAPRTRDDLDRQYAAIRLGLASGELQAPVPTDAPTVDSLVRLPRASAWARLWRRLLGSGA